MAVVEPVENPLEDVRTTPPNVGEVAVDLMRMMVVKTPVDPMAFATSLNDQKEPVYLVAMVLGTQNIQKVTDALKKLKTKMVRVDTFDNLPEPPRRHRGDVDDVVHHD